MPYDCVVVGVGGIGSAALYAAARRGWSVLGMERFGSAHDRGSSHGRTRIIRTAYFEHPHYVPLARRAWDAWESIQGLDSIELVRRTGLLQVGDPDGELIRGVLKSAEEHDLPVRWMSAAETMQRFPALRLKMDSVGVFEESAGFLRVENCVAQFIKLARDRGAELATNLTAQSIVINDDHSITIHTDTDSIRTRRLILTAGPWARQLLSRPRFDIRVLRKQQHWFQLDRHDIKYQNGFPAYLIESANGRCFYGFPEIDYLGMKVAEHTGGSLVDEPGQLNRECDPVELADAERFLDESFHFSRRRLVHQSACMYSMSRDGHFIVDIHPDSDAVAFAAGLSGHGFKFAPLLGERLVGLLERESDPMFDFLRMNDRRLLETG